MPTDLTEKFCFARTPEGIELETRVRMTLERFGYECTEEIEIFGHTEVLVLACTPQPRPNRKERGCEL